MIKSIFSFKALVVLLLIIQIFLLLDIIEKLGSPSDPQNKSLPTGLYKETRLNNPLGQILSVEEKVDKICAKLGC